MANTRKKAAAIDPTSVTRQREGPSKDAEHPHGHDEEHDDRDRARFVDARRGVVVAERHLVGHEVAVAATTPAGIANAPARK